MTCRDPILASVCLLTNQNEQLRLSLMAHLRGWALLSVPASEVGDVVAVVDSEGGSMERTRGREARPIKRSRGRAATAMAARRQQWPLPLLGGSQCENPRHLRLVHVAVMGIPVDEPCYGAHRTCMYIVKSAAAAATTDGPRRDSM